MLKYIDKLAPIGEAFGCSVAKASEAIESVLSQLGLLEAAKTHNKNMQSYDAKIVSMAMQMRNAIHYAATTVLKGEKAVVNLKRI